MFYKILLALSITLAGQGINPANAASFSGNIPYCNALSSGREPSLIPDADRSLPIFQLFCDAHDRERQGNSYVKTFLATQLGRFAQADGIFWAITDRNFSELLCSAMSPTATHIRIFVGGSDSSLRPLSGCNLSSTYTSARSVPPLEGLASIHPKFLAAAAETESWTYVSSGNPTTRSNTVIDFSVLVEGSVTSQLYLWHRCIVQIFDRFMAFPEDKSLERLYQQCSLPSYSVRDAATIPFLMPFDQDAYLSELAFWAGRSDSIDISSQSYNSDRLVNIILRAAKNGAKIRYLRDDDILLSADPGALQIANGYDEHILWDSQLCGPNVSRGYLITNPQYGFLHAKFFIFKGSFGVRVLFGSGNLTHSAITNNLENNYFTSDEELSLGFVGFFDRLWSMSVSYDHWVSVASMIGPYRNRKWVNNNGCA